MATSEGLDPGLDTSTQVSFVYVVAEEDGAKVRVEIGEIFPAHVQDVHVLAVEPPVDIFSPVGDPGGARARVGEDAVQVELLIPREIPKSGCGVEVILPALILFHGIQLENCSMMFRQEHVKNSALI